MKSTAPLSERILPSSLPLVCVALSIVSAVPLSPGAESPALLVPNQETEFTFDFETEAISGTIRTDGPYHGVSRLTDKRTGRQVIDERYSALNLFKLMSANQMMGQPRQMERITTSGPDWVEIRWDATEGHAGTVTARYQVVPPHAVDLAVTVESKASYADYEVFLSNYFDKVLHPRVQLKARGAKPPEWIVPTFNEVFKDTLLVFPRDAHAARLCLDGRWDRNERKTPTIQLTPVRHYAHCLALMTDPDQSTAVALMARPEHCYAISTRYFSEKEEERLTTYSAFDFALFGNDFNPGDRRSVRVRLAVIEIAKEDFSAPLDAYEKFLRETEK